MVLYNRKISRDENFANSAHRQFHNRKFSRILRKLILGSMKWTYPKKPWKFPAREIVMSRNSCSTVTYHGRQSKCPSSRGILTQPDKGHFWNGAFWLAFTYHKCMVEHVLHWQKCNKMHKDPEIVGSLECRDRGRWCYKVTQRSVTKTRKIFMTGTSWSQN